MITRVFTLILLSLVVQACAVPTHVTSRKGTFDLGYRAGTKLGDGEPTNDLPVAAGIHGRYHFDERWAFGAAVELGEGDFETPAELLGLTPAEELDADADITTFMVWFERNLTNASDPHRFYWLFGLGIADVDVANVSGSLAGPGMFNVSTDAGSEIVPTAGLGYQRDLGSGWSFEAVGRYDRHIGGDWLIEDSVSASRQTLDDYGLWSFLFGISYGW